MVAGLGDAEERTIPTSLPEMETAGATSVACGAEYTLALAGSRGDVYSWGWCAPQPLRPTDQADYRALLHRSGLLCHSPQGMSMCGHSRAAAHATEVAFRDAGAAHDVKLLVKPCAVHTCRVAGGDELVSCSAAGAILGALGTAIAATWSCRDRSARSATSASSASRAATRTRWRYAPSRATLP